MPDDLPKSALDMISELVTEENVTNEGEETEVVEPVAQEPEVQETAPVVESSTEEPAVDPVVEPEPKLILGKYRTEEDLANAYKELERKAQEASQRAADHERYIQQMAEEQTFSAFDKVNPTNYEELIALAYEDPDEAFWFAAEKAPKQLSDVLAEIQQYDGRKAAELQMQYNTQLIEQNLRARVQPIQDRTQQADVVQQAQAYATDLHSTIANLPEYESLKGEIAEMLKSRQNLISMENPEASRQVLKDVYELARLSNQRKTEDADTARRLQHSAAAGSPDGIETGAHVETPSVEDEDEATTLRNAILGQANRAIW